MSDTSSWNFAFEQPLHDVFPDLHESLAGFMAQVDSVRAPDRKTHELIRMVCTVILRNAEGTKRHAKLAAEVGATWEEIAGSIVLTMPGFGLLPAVQAIGPARAGFEAADLSDFDDDPGGDDSGASA